MEFRRRQPIGNRGLAVVGAVAGGITFLVLWGDGAEIGRAVLAGAAVAAWIVGFLLALNWSNRMRQQHIADAVQQLSSLPDEHLPDEDLPGEGLRGGDRRSGDRPLPDPDRSDPGRPDPGASYNGGTDPEPTDDTRDGGTPHGPAPAG